MPLVHAKMDLAHHSLVTESTTHLGPSYRILEQEIALVPILGADPINKLKLWSHMPQPISDLANILSGEEYVTASCWKPQLNYLHIKALVEKEKDTTLKSDIQQRIHESKMLSYI